MNKVSAAVINRNICLITNEYLRDILYWMYGVKRIAYTKQNGMRCFIHD